MSKKTALPMTKDRSLGEKSKQLRKQLSQLRVIQHLISKTECNCWQKCNRGVQGQWNLWLYCVTICRFGKRCTRRVQSQLEFVAITIWLIALERVASKIGCLFPYEYYNYIWKVALDIQHPLTCGPAHDSFDEDIPTFEHVTLPSELEFYFRLESS